MQPVGIILLACFLTVISLGITPCRGCGKQFIGRSGYGVLNSPNFPFDYQSHQNCTYEFYVDEYDPQIQTLVCFQFWRFGLPMDDPDCERDYLQFDSVDRSRYCGQGWLAASLQQSGTAWPTVWDEQFCWPIKNKMLTITFSTTSGLHHPGFYATYTVYDVSLGQRSPFDETGPTIGAVSAHPRTAPCRRDQWTCFNRQCIPRNQICNFIDDCEDGSDEQYTHARCRVKDFKPAKSCDFERERCGFLGMRSWKQVDLSRHHRDSLPKPETDHTFQRPGVGSYLLADFFNRSAGYRATLHTQSYHHDTNGCVSFWYQLVGKLTFKFADKIVLDRVGNDTRWHRGQIHVPADVRGGFQIEATKISNNSVVAIDDIYFSDGYCDWEEPSCAFEFKDDTCGWMNRVYEEVVVGSGQAVWKQEDHPGKGRVMSLLVDHAPKELLANITSPPLSAFDNQTFCLQLEYSVPYLLESLAVFGIHLLHWDGMLERRPLWRQNATTDTWQRVSVEVNMSRPFQFQLIGYVRLQGSLKVFVDNVSITRGRCSGTNVTVHDKGGSVGPANLCDTDPWACTAGPTCSDGDCHPEGPQDDLPDKDHDETLRRGEGDEGGDTKDIVSMTSIGLACAVSVGLVLVIGLWVMRMKKRAAERERRRQSTRSARTDTSSMAGGDNDDDDDPNTEAVQEDVPPRYSDAVRQPQRRPELEMTVWTITTPAPSHHSPPPAYEDIVGQPTNQFFPPISSGGYSNPAMTRSTSAPGLQFEHAPVHLPRPEASSGVVTYYNTTPTNTGQFVPSTTRVNVPYSFSPVQNTPTSSDSSSRGRRISSSSLSSTNSGVVSYTQQHLPLPPSSIITSDSVGPSSTVIRIESNPKPPGSRSVSGSSSESV